MKILVVRNAWTDPVGVLGPPLLDAGFELVEWDPRTGSSPAGHSAVIALGGATNPDEDAPWLESERALLREAVRREIPVLAVCLGAQLLAQALGGSAPRMPRTRLGWYPVAAEHAAAGDPLGSAWRSLDHVLEWHDYRFTLPPGGELLAGTPDAVQVFRTGTCAWGFQYHLEADAALVAHWIVVCRDDLVAAGVDPAVLAADGRRLGADQAEHGRAVGHAFASVVARRTASPH